MRPAQLVPLVSCLLLSFACSREDDDKPKPTGERTKEPVPETPKDAPTGPFAGFDFAAAAQRWQGAWVLPGETAGSKVAWEVRGDKVMQADGGAERTFDFAIYSPCQVSYTDADAGETTFKTFTFAGDQLYAGLGAAGLVVGDTTIVCSGGDVLTLRGGECLKWSEMFDDWKSEKAECSISGEGEARRFVAGSSSLSFVDGGSALVDEQMRGQMASSHADFGAAKQVLGGG